MIRQKIFSLFAAGAALAALTSCSTDALSSLLATASDDGRISFTATADGRTDAMTRAAVSQESATTAFQGTQPGRPLTLSASTTGRASQQTRGYRLGDRAGDELTAFRVSAIKADRNITDEEFALATPSFFYNLKAEKNAGTGVFEITQDYYWPASNEQLWFYAYAPVDNSNVVVSSQSTGGAQRVSFTADPTVANQVDLMTANTATTAFQSASGDQTSAAVPLNFRHELTAIRFVIGEQWLKGTIESVAIRGVHGTGTLVIGNEGTWEWKDKNGAAVTAGDDFVLTLNRQNVEGTQNEQFIDDQDLYFLMIPQAFDAESNARIEVRYLDGAQGYTVSARLYDLRADGQDSYQWTRNTTVTYAISSQSLTKLRLGNVLWPDESADGAWNGPKKAFAAGDALGLYVVGADGSSLPWKNVKCTCTVVDGTPTWTVEHPAGDPVFHLPGQQYFLYYPYNDAALTDSKYPSAATGTDMTHQDFFGQLIGDWQPVQQQNDGTRAVLDAQDLQTARAADDGRYASMVNAQMAHQMNIACLTLGTKNVTGTISYTLSGDNSIAWQKQATATPVTASSDFSVYLPYCHTDGNYYYVFAPVKQESDYGLQLKGLNALQTADDWTWPLKTLERGKLLTHTAYTSSNADATQSDALAVAAISDLTAGQSSAVPVSVTISGSPLSRGTDYTVTFQTLGGTTVTEATVVSTANTYKAYIAPAGSYSGGTVTRQFTVSEPPYTNLSAATSSHIGWVVTSKGHIFDKVANITDGGTAQAMIAYIGTESNCSHGLAIALADASTSCTWNNAASTVSSWAGSHSVSGGTWRLPSGDDWMYMFQACGGSTRTTTWTDRMSYSNGNFRTKLKALNSSYDVQSDRYCSSKECDSGNAWGYYFSDSKFRWYSKSYYSSYVRAVLAF